MKHLSLILIVASLHLLTMYGELSHATAPPHRTVTTASPQTEHAPPNTHEHESTPPLHHEEMKEEHREEEEELEEIEWELLAYEPQTNEELFKDYRI